MVKDVQLLDAAGNCLLHVGRTLDGCRLKFSVSAADAGDVFRVEVLGDPTTGPPKEIPQLVAGAFGGSEEQVMMVDLEGRAFRDYDVSIYRLSETQAKRDVNGDAELVYRQTFPV